MLKNVSAFRVFLHRFHRFSLISCLVFSSPARFPKPCRSYSDTYKVLETLQEKCTIINHIICFTDNTNYEDSYEL